MDIHLSYQLVRSRKRRKTISLHIKEDGKIVVHAPYHMPKWEIEKFIEEKQSWMVRKISEKERSIRKAEKEFAPGEEFLYLGESYPLEIQDTHRGEHPLKLSFGRFVLDEHHVKEARGLFVQLYKKEAKVRITERIGHYSHRLDLFPKGIKITSANYRWGSCSRDNRLCFSWRIIMASLSIIDYILIHELIHIKEKNHSRRFWNELESIIPDYREHRLWLKKNGHSLCL